MKVICAGLCKTGTKTMDTALRILGYRVSDVYEQLYEFTDEWYGLICEGKLPDFKAMFKDIDTVSDLPCCFFFEEILAAFPDAKVILMLRDERSWVESWRLQLQDMKNMSRGMNLYLSYLDYLSPTWFKIKHFVVGMINAALGSLDPFAKHIHLHSFRMHNDRVKATVPKEQLLVYSVAQGWKPLCEFLECEIPSVEFPHENKDRAMTGKRPKMPKSPHESRGAKKIHQEALVRSIICVCLMIFVIYVCIKLYQFC